MGRPTLDKKNTEFKMRMSETEKNKLKELADFYKTSMSEVITMLIDEDYKLVNKIEEIAGIKAEEKRSVGTRIGKVREEYII